jgi:hypothetical protein
VEEAAKREVVTESVGYLTVGWTKAHAGDL